MYDYLIAGADFTGVVPAERPVSQTSKRILGKHCIPHTGGNTYEHHYPNGVFSNKYVTHIFIQILTVT